MILNAALKADYEPGSNRSEDIACADWRFLLPSMELEQILYIGSPNYFYLFERHYRSADTITKMTRISHFNCRLEHEYEMLSSVQKKRLVYPDSFPAPLFFDHHNGLAILGQKAMKGHPFRTQTTDTLYCPIAADAINWITTLGKNSKNTEPASSLEVSGALFKLFDIFNRI